MLNTKVEILCKTIGKEYFKIPGVLAVVVSGSRVSPFADDTSDIDMYVYSNTDLSVSDRSLVANKLGENCELNNQFWETGDEWNIKSNNLLLDVMFRHVSWAEDVIDSVVNKYQASVGYSTCLLHNIAESVCLFEKDNWFSQLQKKANSEYPEQLTVNILEKNYPLLSKNHSSYRAQIIKAVSRKDLVSVNHRITAFLASYFDIIFALNMKAHPGEKKLFQWACHSCQHLPKNMVQDISGLLTLGSNFQLIPDYIDSLVNNLVILIKEQGFSTNIL